jgi:hypothetical protein
MYNLRLLRTVNILTGFNPWQPIITININTTKLVCSINFVYKESKSYHLWVMDEYMDNGHMDSISIKYYKLMYEYD